MPTDVTPELTEPDRTVALVTGATRGLGLAVARALCTGGTDVLLNYAHDDAARAALDMLAGLPGRARLVKADAGTAAGVHQLLDDIATVHGHLDVLVHCAGALQPMPASAPQAQACERDLAVVLGPLLHGTARLVELLRPGRGRVIAVSSSGARSVIPGYFGQGVAKAALESAMRYLAAELAGRGITANVVSAGKLAHSAAGELAARVAARTPAGRLTTAEEVADVITLLCRKESAALHGQVLTVDGGLGLLA
jgi:enoyl-[acyl-carrier protein] reductase III